MSLHQALDQFLNSFVVAMGPPRPGMAFNSIPEMLLKKGDQFSNEAYTEEEREALLGLFGQSGRAPILKGCYYNAQGLALDVKGLEYAEGYVLREGLPIAIEHGWNVLPSGKVVDVTLREPGEKTTCKPEKLLERAERNLENAYRGIVIPKNDIRKIWAKVGAAVNLLEDRMVVDKLMKKHEMGGLRDVPLPPNVPRPEMWTTRAIVQAVHDGFRFMIPFVIGDSFYSENAYWIGGAQYGASGLTVGPEHTPEIMLLQPDEWIRAKTFFRPEMVPERTWVERPNEYGVVPVYLEIDPATIDWELLNRGHQIGG